MLGAKLFYTKTLSAPNLQQALQSYKDEAHLWQFSGAKGLAALENRALARA